MNGRKKLLCVLLLSFFLFCYTSINVFADITVSSSASSVGTSSAESSSSPSGSDQNPAKPVEGSAVPSVASSAPSSEPASSVPSPSSKRHRRRAVSSDVSSMPESFPDFAAADSSESSSGEISLPQAGVVSENDPYASASGGVSSKLMTRTGILAWVCIGLGVLVVLIVILSNRRPPRGPGRSRYHRPKRGGGKHLLNDKYYRGLNRY